MSYVLVQLELLARLIISGICGSLIGYERKNRLKEAGVRTHMIVALGAALIMIVSKYGFTDVLGNSGYSLDPSRISAQVVSGIGFLGAGMIFVRKQAISGLTTAAGIWTTAGIGMAIGAKLYFLGVASTLMVLFVQVILYKKSWLHQPALEQVSIEIIERPDSISYIQNKFQQNNIEIINFRAEKTGEGLFNVDLSVKLPQEFEISRLMDLFKDNPNVITIEY